MLDDYVFRKLRDQNQSKSGEWRDEKAERSDISTCSHLSALELLNLFVSFNPS